VTDATPKAVYVRFEAAVYDDGDWIDLPVENIVASMDIDRVPYCMATFTLGVITEAQWLLLDGRNNLDPGTGFDTNVRFRMRLFDVDGTIINWLGAYAVIPDEDEWMELHIRSAVRDYLSGVTTVECSGKEALMDDKKAIRTTVYDTGATSVLELVEYSLFDVFGGVTYGNDPIVGSTTIPAGDRRKINQGESHNQLIEPELTAIDCRLYDYWGHAFFIGDRNAPENYTSHPLSIDLATYTEAEGLSSFVDADPIVYSITETISRDGDWGDGVLVKYDTLEAGTAVDYQIDSGGGFNTKGIVATWQRPKTADNAADPIATRALIRGRDIEVTARARFDVWPAMDLTVYMRGRTSAPLPTPKTAEGIIRSIEWDAADATMRITAKTGEPVE
jgi:hypothetical protein